MGVICLVFLISDRDHFQGRLRDTLSSQRSRINVPLPRDICEHEYADKPILPGELATSGAAFARVHHAQSERDRVGDQQD